MPLLNTVAIAGRNLNTVVDVFQADSAVTTLTAAAGGQVNTNSDFREQVLPVVRDTTDVVPIGEGVTQTKADATVATPKFAVQKWPVWRAVTQEVNANTDPASLAMDIVSSMAPRFPIGFDKYYTDQIVAGASVTEIVFNPAQGVASLKSVLAEFTTTSYAADGFLMTRLGTNELGWNVTGDLLRMDLTQATGLNTAQTGAVLAAKGANNVLGVIGPWGQSALAVSAGMSMTVHPDATIDGNGPENGYINHRGMMAMGWGNAQATTAAQAITGAGFVVLTLA